MLFRCVPCDNIELPKTLGGIGPWGVVEGAEDGGPASGVIEKWDEPKPLDLFGVDGLPDPKNAMAGYFQLFFWRSR